MDIMPCDSAERKKTYHRADKLVGTAENVACGECSLSEYEIDRGDRGSRAGCTWDGCRYGETMLKRPPSCA